MFVAVSLPLLLFSRFQLFSFDTAAPLSCTVCSVCLVLVAQIPLGSMMLALRGYGGGKNMLWIGGRTGCVQAP